MDNNTDVAKAISQALYDVKHKIHDRAVDPRIKGVDPYVSIKTVDAIIANCLAKYSAEEKYYIRSEEHKNG